MTSLDEALLLVSDVEETMIIGGGSFYTIACQWHINSI
ncbi:hypothetical protein JCM19239_3657 [Vibrio variabilis]|uniref:Dihydrofolate reductase n=1 Tax=Vibrio variabilis TaxID=990271 RepID=A0ABQ0JC30_9VIBR|nr:hypothetical protein JCM19239_3657 [Vibrio variabilis]